MWPWDKLLSLCDLGFPCIEGDDDSATSVRRELSMALSSCPLSNYSPCLTKPHMLLTLHFSGHLAPLSVCDRCLGWQQSGSCHIWCSHSWSPLVLLIQVLQRKFLGGCPGGFEAGDICIDLKCGHLRQGHRRKWWRIFDTIFCIHHWLWAVNKSKHDTVIHSNPKFGTNIK